MATITWLDKVDGLDLLDPQKNVNAADMNQIKTTVNANDTSFSSHTGNTSNPHSVTKTQVGLGNVDNTSDATKNAATATLTNKTLTSPVINSPTGLVKGDVGLGNVDNTSDTNKPVSTPQQTALDLKANLASPTFTGTPAGPTATPGDNTTKLATTAFVSAAVVAVSSAVPLLTSFVDDENVSGTMNDINVTFALANTPISGTVKLYWNGMRMKVGVG